MNELEIDLYLKNDLYTSGCYRGVMSFEELPHLETRRPSLYVINTDKRSGPGLHWTVLHLPSEKNDPPEFFDSLAETPSHYNASIENYLIRHGPQYNIIKDRIQGKYSSVCGNYCVLFAYFRCRGYSLEQFVSNFDRNDVDMNDVMVTF